MNERSVQMTQQPLASKHRRPHQKTKTGCLDCRRRRVKCDERKPNCRSCVRRGVSCEYKVEGKADTTVNNSTRHHESPSTSSPLSHGTSPSSQYAQAKTQNPDLRSTEPSACAQLHSTLPDLTRLTALSSTPSFSMGDLALLHHWMLSTSLSICRDSSSSDMWQRVFPEIGFQHPYVAHSILSLAALHVTHFQKARDDSTEVSVAVEHHNEALRGFRQAATSITESNSEALFVWSLLNMIYVFAISSRGNATGDGGVSHTSRKDVILGIEWIPMIRGIDSILIPTHNYLRFGRMQQLMSLGNWDDLQPGPVNPEGPDGYLCCTRETWKDNQVAEMYDEVLALLRKCRLFILQFQTMDDVALAGWGYNRSWSGPLMFIHFAPQAYFTQVHQRQPPALILFAYFGALLHGLDDYWFLEGWGRRIVEVVEDLLGAYWRPWIAWPLEVVGLT